jgi:phosphatidylinositol 4-kinase
VQDILFVLILCLDSPMPCFGNTEGAAVAALRDRFQLSLTGTQLEDFIEKLVLSSCCNVFTRLYDSFQYYSNGIL